MIEIDKEYFSNITKLINEKFYNQFQPNCNGKSVPIYNFSDKNINSIVTPKLESEGFAIAQIDNYVDFDPADIGLRLEKLFGEQPSDKNPGNRPYAKVQAEENAKHYINSNMAQPIHTDQGYTTQYPRYAALYCFKQAQSGGDSIVVSFKPLYALLKNHFGGRLDKLFLKDSITVKSANGHEQKPIFLLLENGDVGISYSPVLQKMWCTDDVFRIFDYITSYIHNPNNQIRFKLREGQILLIDNCRTLHGRTAFPKDDGRLLFRYWFGNKNL